MNALTAINLSGQYQHAPTTFADAQLAIIFGLSFAAVVLCEILLPGSVTRR